MTEWVTRWIAIRGNVKDGLIFYGPFDTLEDAENWAYLAGVYDTVLAEIAGPKGKENGE